jgi:hypothetical protein
MLRPSGKCCLSTAACICPSPHEVAHKKMCFVVIRRCQALALPVLREIALDTVATAQHSQLTNGLSAPTNISTTSIPALIAHPSQESRPHMSLPGHICMLYCPCMDSMRTLFMVIECSAMADWTLAPNKGLLSRSQLWSQAQDRADLCRKHQPRLR